MIKHLKYGVLLGATGAFLLNMPIICAENAKLVLGTKVENHVMQNEKNHFAFHDGRVCAQITLQPSEEGHLTFVWTRDGHPYSAFKTVTKSSARYRTHACVTARPGNWHVAVKTDSDKVLAQLDFSVDGDAVHPVQKEIVVPHKKVEPAIKDEKTDSVKPDAANGIGDALKAIQPIEPEKPASNPVELKKAVTVKDDTVGVSTGNISDDIKVEKTAPHVKVTEKQAVAEKQVVDQKTAAPTTPAAEIVKK